MGEFLSKFTFGFLMAQFAPGAVAVVFASAAYSADAGKHKSALELLRLVCSKWLSEPEHVIAFSLLAAGVGMFLHGLNWAVLAWLEDRNRKGGDDPPLAHESFWHEWPLWLQVLASPIKMVAEVGWMLVCAPRLDSLTMSENVPKIGEDRMDQFRFLQEFYLSFAQFYSHMAYALLASIPLLLWTWSVMSFTRRRALLLVVLYFAGSVFFIAGRVQLGSLFKAERRLRGGPSGPAP